MMLVRNSYLGTMLAFATAFVLAFVLVAPAYADDTSDDDVNIVSVNSASVSNNVTVTATTGNNRAHGGFGDDAGDSGSASSSGEDQEGSNSAGNGGKGGNGGSGGSITTGDAFAGAEIGNLVNGNDVEVDLTGDDGSEDEFDDTDDDVNAVIVNSASLSNNVSLFARTGNNRAHGSDGGLGGNGGSASSAGDDQGGNNNGGDGGNGGNGGDGGDISTGMADSFVGIANIVNAQIVRVVR